MSETTQAQPLPAVPDGTPLKPPPAAAPGEPLRPVVPHA